MCKPKPSAPNVAPRNNAHSAPPPPPPPLNVKPNRNAGSGYRGSRVGSPDSGAQYRNSGWDGRKTLAGFVAVAIVVIIFVLIVAANREGSASSGGYSAYESSPVAADPLATKPAPETQPSDPPATGSETTAEPVEDGNQPEKPVATTSAGPPPTESSPGSVPPTAVASASPEVAASIQANASPATETTPDILTKLNAAHAVTMEAKVEKKVLEPNMLRPVVLGQKLTIAVKEGVFRKKTTYCTIPAGTTVKHWSMVKDNYEPIQLPGVPQHHSVDQVLSNDGICADMPGRA